MVTTTKTSSDPDTVDLDVGPVPQLVLAFGPPGVAPARRALLGAAVDIGRKATPLGLGPLDDGRMSRSHARLEQGRGGWQVTDRGSRNGTAVNGQRVDGPTPLTDRDVIRTGDTLWVSRRAPMGRRIELPQDPEHPLVGISPEFELLRADLEVVAPRTISVLVLGETGTGKEVVARTLHRASGRGGRFMAQSCAALPSQLLESTLFGHVKGAFTGATADRPGVMQEADGGTLFLDELGEMPPAVQSKLLRALETQVVRRLGSTTDERIDLRVVSATNRDLAGAVRDGDFRLDLFGRLAAWTLTLQPLRLRPEDVPTLAARFTDRSLDPNLIEALMLHPWPLNVRGLRSVIERAAVRPDGPLMLDRQVRAALAQSRALMAQMQRGGSSESEDSQGPATDDPSADESAVPGAEVLADALRAHDGRVSAVARALDASRQQVYRWMKRHGLSADDFRS